MAEIKLEDKDAVLKLCDEVDAREKAATKGPWDQETEQIRTDRSAYQKLVGPNGEVLCDTLNSDAACIHEDEGHRWDETGRKNFDFIAHAREDIPDLSRLLREAVGRIDELDCTLEDEQAAHQETLLLWEKSKSRIAELEAELVRYEVIKQFDPLSVNVLKANELMIDADNRRIAAESEVERLRKDAERLDWLESQKRKLFGGWEGYGCSGPEYWRDPRVEWSIGKSMKHGTYEMPQELENMTLRIAIDAAMSSDTEEAKNRSLHPHKRGRSPSREK